MKKCIILVIISLLGKKKENNDLIIINKNNSLKNNINIIKNNKDKEENIIKKINENVEKQVKEDKVENDEIKEKKEQYKNYFFNEKEMIINLSNYKGESIKTVELINPSIYCFMISILQSLISIPELNFFFLSKIYLISSLYNNDNNENFDEDNLEDNYPICKSYQTFIKIYLLSKKKLYTNPSKFIPYL